MIWQRHLNQVIQQAKEMEAVKWKALHPANAVGHAEDRLIQLLDANTPPQCSSVDVVSEKRGDGSKDTRT